MLGILSGFLILGLISYMFGSLLNLYYSLNDENKLIIIPALTLTLITVIFTFLLFSFMIWLTYDEDKDNGNGWGGKKIYPDNSDYSEKVLELYK